MNLIYSAHSEKEKEILETDPNVSSKIVSKCLIDMRFIRENEF